MADEEKDKKEENQKSGEEKIGETAEEKFAACEKQRDEYLAGWQRAKADFINYKKDEIKRLEEVARYGTEDLMEELITVLDNFDLGLTALEKAGPVEKGIYMIRSQIEDILKKRGLSRIPIKIGDQFDPAVAEVIAEIEADQSPGTIVEEIEAGYLLHDKIIRPVRVKVAKQKQENRN